MQRGLVGARVAGAVALLAALGLLLGCQLLFGDFNLAEVPPDSEASVVCESGEYRCNAEYLLSCKSDRTGWELADTCATPERCDSRNGVCKVCSDGDLRCNGATREACAADGSGWNEVESCPSAELCNPGFCGLCPTPGAVQCSAPGTEASAAATVLQICVEAVGWQTLDDTCATEQLCLASADRAVTDPGNWTGKCDQPVCDPGQLRCEGATLLRCAQGRDRWTQVDICASDALCELAVDTASSPDASATVDSCPVGCSPAGAFFCDGAVLQRCRDDLTGWEVITECPPDRTCDPGLGECRGPCNPGEFRCNAQNLEQCSPEQTWELEQACASAALCSVAQDPGTLQWSGACQPPTCPVAGQYMCEGANLFECNSDLTTWEPRGTCASAALCNATSHRCDPAGCTPAGGLRCSPANPLQLQQCSSDLTEWIVIETCPEDQSCNADPAGPACLAQCPTPPDRCIGRERQACSDAGGQPVWTPVATCATQELCECGLDNSCLMGIWEGDGVCGVVACGGSLPDYQCDGALLQECDDGRNGWNDVEDCGAPDLCFPGTDSDAGHCLTCAVAGEIQCFTGTAGPARRTCAPDRQSWLNQQNCTYGCVDSGTADYCAACAAGELRCDSDGTDAILQRCTADRRDLTLYEDCEFTCVDSGTADRCAICAEGESRCNGATERQSCDANLLGLSTAEVCEFSCIDDGLADYCGECIQDQKQCTADGTTLQTCAGGRWGSDESCTYACIDAGTADYCAPECVPGHSECTGATARRVCAADGEWTDAPVCDIACIDSGSLDFCAPECAPGDTLCTATGEGYRACNSETGEWVDQPVACIDPSPVCLAGGCVQCDPSATPATCIDDDTLQTCSSAGSLVSSDCTDVCTTVNGIDGCHACAPQSTECVDDTTLRTCSASGTWSSASCGIQVCAEITNVAGCYDCVLGDFECVTTTTFRTCLPDGSWNEPAACANAAECSNNACEDCADNAKECASSDSIRTCVAGAWDAATSCTNGCFGTYPDAYCGGCASGEQQCSGQGVPQTCVNGQWQDASACIDPQFCLGGACVDCAAGHQNCNGSILQTCNSTTGQWQDSETCANGCFGTAPGAYCGECAEGDHDCYLSDLQSCDSATGQWQSQQTCDDGCYGVAPDAYCGQCTEAETRCSDVASIGAVETCSEGIWGTAVSCTDSSCNGNVCGICINGESRCTDSAETGTVETCVSGTWGPAASCEGRSCNGEVCGDCLNGSTRCDANGDYQECSGGIWGTTSCSATQTCDPEQGCVDTGGTGGGGGTGGASGGMAGSSAAGSGGTGGT